MRSESSSCPFSAGAETLRTAPLADIDPTDAAVLREPVEYYRRLRNEAPVWRDPRTGVVYISSYELVRKALMSPGVFSSDFMKKFHTGTGAPDPDLLAVLAQSWPDRRALLYADDPDHARQKHIAKHAFMPSRVNALTERITGFVDELIDSFVERGHCELKGAFADHLPSFVIASMLNLPQTDIPLFQSWVRAFITVLGNQLADSQERIAAARKLIDQQEYMAALIAERRRNPGEDIISDMLAAEWVDNGEKRTLDDHELYAMLRQIFTAGQETTVHSLCAAIYYLLTNPEQRALLEGNPALIDKCIEETLRLIAPVSAMWRKVVTDVEIGGVQLSAGDWVMLRFAAANLDDSKFTSPECFDIQRANAGHHLTLSYGVHYCLGANLARKQLATAIPILLKRLKNLRLAEPDRPLEFILTPTLRGVRELQLRFDPGPRLRKSG